MAVRCPLCDVPMRELVRREVRIDVCPECKGVWLDRGELDKLLAAEARWEGERWGEGSAASRPERPAPAHPAPPYPPYREEYRHRDEEHYRDDYYHFKKKKKKGFLGEIFEIFD